MATYLEEQGYCESCRRNTLVRGRGVNHVLHLLLSLFCCGVWVWVWAILCIMPIEWRCTKCGDRVRMPAGGMQFLGYALLVMGALSVAGVITIFILALVAPKLSVPSTDATPTETEVARKPNPIVPELEPLEPRPIAKNEPRNRVSEKKGGPERVGLEVPVTIEGVSVAVMLLEVAPTEYTDTAGRDRVTGKNYVNIYVGITVEDKVVTYKPWQTATLNVAHMEDNFGNTYQTINFGLDKPIGRKGTTSVRADKPVADLLVFDTPLDSAEYLDLDLPAENVGVRGKSLLDDGPVFRFRLPLKKEAAKPERKPEPKVEAPAPKPESQPEGQQRPVVKPTVKITLTPPKGDAIMLGVSAYSATTAAKEPEVRPKWEKTGQLRVISAPTEVELVERDWKFSRVSLDGKEWFVETRWLPPEKK